ncbi:transposase family protein [Serinicoccus sediminis]|uniref:transposase family protein n=1 Tax=Serinicoccus sediminis TaxID=2306021 RepID=UPI001EDFE196|nr:transposase family protein [Serinicoccus sediminis]
MDHPTSCCRALGAGSAYCDNCDLLVGLAGYHVLDVARGPDGLVVRVESATGPVGCPDCGVRASSRGRREHRLVDIPAFGVPVRLVWVKRTWACGETEVSAALVHRGRRGAGPAALDVDHPGAGRGGGSPAP